jgi:hypothetical protein
MTGRRQSWTLWSTGLPFRRPYRSSCLWTEPVPAEEYERQPLGSVDIAVDNFVDYGAVSIGNRGEIATNHGSLDDVTASPYEDRELCFT